MKTDCFRAKFTISRDAFCIYVFRRQSSKAIYKYFFVTNLTIPPYALPFFASSMLSFVTFTLCQLSTLPPLILARVKVKGYWSKFIQNFEKYQLIIDNWLSKSTRFWPIGGSGPSTEVLTVFILMVVHMLRHVSLLFFDTPFSLSFYIT